MPMSRQDYERVAKAMNAAKPPVPAGDSISGIIDLGIDTWWNCVLSLADSFAADNYKFNRDKFIKACNKEISHE